MTWRALHKFFCISAVSLAYGSCIRSSLQPHGASSLFETHFLPSAADANGTVTDGGQSAVWGPWAEHVAELFQEAGVQCQVLQSRALYQDRMIEKLLWSCIFWMMSAALKGMQVRRGPDIGSSCGRHRKITGYFFLSRAQAGSDS